jgi:hypothetical protein
MHEDEQPVKPTEQRGGTTPGGEEAEEKGQWASTAEEGMVPTRLGGSDAPEEMLDDDPQLGSSVLGHTTGSDAPATESGVDPAGGEHADAVTDGGAAAPPPGAEPDLRDAGAGPRQADRRSADA